MTEFVHLHVHSEYSVSDGLLTMKSINQLAQERELAALAITDKCNLFAFVKFYDNAIAFHHTKNIEEFNQNFDDAVLSNEIYATMIRDSKHLP